MTCATRTVQLLTATLTLVAAPVRAHHAFDAVDLDTRVTISGRIVEFRWTNPHTLTWLDVTNEDGSVTRWRLEGMSPSFLGRRGWTRHTLAAGDAVEVLVAPLRNGDSGGTFLRARLENGTELIMFGGR